MEKLKSFFSFLTEAPDFIEDPLERMQASFVLGAMLVVLAAFSCVMIFIYAFQKPWVDGFEPQTIVVTTTFFLSLMNFFLGRGRYHYHSRHINVLTYVLAWMCGLYFSGHEDVFIPLGFIPAHIIIFVIFFPFRVALAYGMGFALSTILFINFFVEFTPAPKPYYFLVAVFFLILLTSASYLLNLYNKATYRQAFIIQKSEALRENADQMASYYNFSSLGAMIAEIMHEINNPLQISFTCQDVLRDKTQEKGCFGEVEEVLNELDKAHQRIAKTIENVSRYYRTSTETEGRELKSLKEIWETAQYLVAYRSRKHKIPLFSKGEIGDIKVATTELELSQVLVNLINNAIDAVKKTPVPWIEVEFNQFGDHLMVKVTNSGQALSEESAYDFMTSFRTTKAPGKGSGMGLPICKRIIEVSLKGNFFYKVEEGHSCFGFNIPLRMSPHVFVQEELS